MIMNKPGYIPISQHGKNFLAVAKEVIEKTLPGQLEARKTIKRERG